MTSSPEPSNLALKRAAVHSLTDPAPGNFEPASNGVLLYDEWILADSDAFEER